MYVYLILSNIGNKPLFQWRQYARQLLKACCASYAKGLAPHALYLLRPGMKPFFDNELQNLFISTCFVTARPEKGLLFWPAGTD